VNQITSVSDKNCQIKRIHINEYEECIGIFRGFRYDGECLVVHIGVNELALLTDNLAIDEIIQKLQAISEGEHVALFRVSPRRFVIRKC
jgi:hypothetical protein